MNSLSTQRSSVKVSSKPRAEKAPRAAKGRKPKVRSVCLVRPFGLMGEEGHVRITEDGQPTDFMVDQIPADWGHAFYLTKFESQRRGDGDDHYAVNIDGQGGTCECKGFLRWNHCRHIEAFNALHRQGKLPLPIILPEPCGQSCADEVPDDGYKPGCPF